MLDLFIYMDHFLLTDHAINILNIQHSLGKYFF